MRKKTKIFIMLLFLFSATLFSYVKVVSAESITTGVITAELNLRVREKPTTDSNQLGWAVYNTTVTILSYADSGNGCDDKWAEIITVDGVRGYACSTFIKDIKTQEIPDAPDNDMSKMTDEEFEAYLTSQQFPESYKVKLRVLHKAHPNWVFVGVKTKYNWSNALKNQNVAGRNTYQVYNIKTNNLTGYLSTDDAYYSFYTDTFKVMEGSTWYQANSKVVEYYLDPRNFLNENDIFMFEKLSYNATFQTSDVVKNLLYSNFYSDLIQYFMEAAKKFQVSPVYLAAKARQEVGINGGVATNGKAGDYCSVSGLNGYYNFYGIGATDGVCTGMKYAKTQGWNTKQKAIVNGAEWIVSGYIAAKQDTTYFQKFNTSLYATKDIWHQYAADVQYAYHTSQTTRSTYKSLGLTNIPYVFDIPIYDGIPASTALPKLGNPNNYLKTLKVNGTGVTNFDGAKTSYKVNVPYNVNEVKIEATTVNSNAKISGLPANNLYKITADDSNVSLTVTAQNGNTKTYTINIVRLPAPVEPEENDKDEDKGKDNTSDQVTYLTPDETVTKTKYNIKKTNYMTNITLGTTVESLIKKLEATNPYASINITNSGNKAKTSGSIVTGDKITIESGENSKTFTAVIYGDLNGDGAINVVDLGKVQKHLLKVSTLTGAYLEAADTDKNGTINVVDLGKVQKHLLKVSNISQS